MKDRITYKHKIHNKEYVFELWKEHILEVYQYKLKINEHLEKKPPSLITIVRNHFRREISTILTRELNNENEH